jgi:hypothetical protein
MLTGKLLKEGYKLINMKKILIALVLVCFVGIIKAQTYMPKGMVVGVSKSSQITNEANIKKITSTANDIKFFDSGNDTLNPYIPVASRTNVQDLAPMLNDTIPLATFGAGAGLTADTALFNDDVLIGAFFNDGSDTLVITQMISVMYSGTGTETIAVQISWDANFIDGTPTNLGASAFVVAGAEAIEGGAGEVDTSFSNTKIPPNNWVWGRLSGASKDNKPTFLNVTLSGYKIPTY